MLEIIKHNLESYFDVLNNKHIINEWEINICNIKLHNEEESTLIETLFTYKGMTYKSYDRVYNDQTLNDIIFDRLEKEGETIITLADYM